MGGDEASGRGGVALGRGWGAAAVGGLGGKMLQDLLDDAGLGNVHHDTGEEVLGVRWRRRRTGRVARSHARGVRHRLDRYRVSPSHIREQLVPIARSSSLAL